MLAVCAAALTLLACQDILGVRVPVPDDPGDVIDAGIQIDAEVAEICDDGADNDGDGDADCDDSDCVGNTACPEICDDGIDNDGDDALDCGDSDCLGDAACPEICDDGLDNDGDEATDCDDGDCLSDAACATLFVATGARGTIGSLFRVDPATAEFVEVAPLTIGYTGLAFAPDGTLFGATAFDPGVPARRPELGLGAGSRGPRHALGGGGGLRELRTINPVDGTEEIIAPIDDGSGETFNIADITFVGKRLIGWADPGLDDPVEINTATGVPTILGPGTNSGGSGMAADGDGNVFIVPLSTDEVFQVDPIAGGVTSLGVLIGVPLDRINAMTFLNGTLFAVTMDNSSPRNATLISIDLGTLEVTELGPLPPDVDSIAGTAP
jgi:hypothetical protein